jgi:myo-inositol 2-dehydrogenase/D-chiro-inositol 1-dehydrogenase
VKSVAASGIVAVAAGLKEHGNCDNAISIVEFFGGKVAYFFCSRMMAHGQEDTIEIIGTEGKLANNANPQTNFVNIYTSTGINREVPVHYYGRFEHDFVQEANERTSVCLDDTKLPMKFSNTLRAVEIGSYLQETLRTGREVEQASL